jgi:DNA-directed RNA polymerase specialized sigma subunit
MDRAKEDGAAKEILQESLTKVNRDDGSTSDDDEDDSDEDGLAYQEASSIELPKEYEFKRRVEENDYFNILLDPSEEGIRVTLKLVDKGTRQPNYCRALSNDEIYVPMHIFAALGLHDNQIDWIGSNGQQEVILGRLKRPSIQPEVPEAEQLEVSNINPSDKRSDKGFDIKIDLENGHKPEAMYLDVLEIEGYLGISAMPVELDDTTRDLPNVSANTSQTKNTLQFRIPVSIVNALGLDDVNEFRWFTQGESISLILADDKSFTEKAQEDDEGKSTIDYTEYENIDSLLADLENRTLASQREIIRKRVLNPDIGLESIVNSPDVDVTGKIVKETLDEYGEIIQHFASSDTNDVSEREGVGDSKLEDYVDENDRETVHDEKSHSLSNKENTNGENNREKLLNSIEKVHEELGKIPTIEEIEEKTTYSRKDYYEYFGSWIEALDEAGYNYKNANRNDPTEEELLNGIREVGQKLGERPTQADMEEVSPYTSSNYKAQFDNPSWTTALEKVGYEFSRGTNTDKQIEEELLDAIQWAYEKLGRKPTAKDVYDMFSYSRGEYQAAFGSWITALEEAGYEYESGNRDINQTGPRSGNKKHDQESEKILEFSKEGARMKEVVQKPLTGGRKEVTIEKVDESSFPIDNLYLHVNSVDVDEKGNNVRLQFEQTSDTELDTKYLLEFTGGRAELKEITEKVFGEGTNEVTIETIDWDQEVTDTIDMQVAEIRLQNGDPSRPTLSLSSIDKQN